MVHALWETLHFKHQYRKLINLLFILRNQANYVWVSNYFYLPFSCMKYWVLKSYLLFSVDFVLKQVKVHVIDCFLICIIIYSYIHSHCSRLYKKCFGNNCEILLSSENQTGKSILFYPDDIYIFFVSHSSLNDKTSFPLCTLCTNGYIWLLELYSHRYNLKNVMLFFN